MHNAVQVLGTLIKNPSIILDGKYTLFIEDFWEEMHRTVFFAINNLYLSGIKKIDEVIIDDYLSQYSNKHKIFTQNNGIEYCRSIVEIAKEENFDFNYNALKKFSLLRFLNSQNIGIDEFYNPNIIDVEDEKALRQKLEKANIEDILNVYESKVSKAKDKFFKSTEELHSKAGDLCDNLLERYKQAPEVGVAGQSKILNTISRGFRRKKFYLRSAMSGFGKTRLAIGDLCNFTIGRKYNWEIKKWEDNGFRESGLFISTEVDNEEIETMIMANISGVDEYKILEGICSDEEEAIIKQANKYIKESNYHIVENGNFDIDDIERIIKKYKIEHGVNHIFFDYMFITIKLMEQISKVSNGMKLREDQILTIFSTRLKNLCNSLDIFIYAGTQVNGETEKAEVATQNNLRGSKAIADRMKKIQSPILVII